MKSWRIRSADPSATPDTISAEELARRIGATTVRAAGPDAGRGEGAADPVPTSAPSRSTASPVRSPGAPRLSSVRHARPIAGSGSRALIWRDASALLLAVVGFILIAQLALGNLGGSGLDSGPPGQRGAPTDAAIAAPPGSGPSDVPTIGPILDPNLIPAILATPTPTPTLPPATLRPAATSRPTVRPTVRPTATAKVTARPTASPTASPAPTPSPSSSPTLAPTPIPPAPTPTPTPTPPPEPLMLGAISCTPSTAAIDEQIGCNVAITAGTVETFSWDFGDGTAASADATHTYTADGTYIIRVDASGPGGSDFSTTSYTVVTP